jgi:hypothetical protein
MESVSQNETNDSITKKATVVGAHVSAAGVVATSLFVIVDKATQNPTVVAALMGGVALIPGVGQTVILLSAAVAVGYFAMKMVYAQLAKYKTAIRLIDEFTILLHKIQKITNLTIFISTTYNFDINIDEVIEQLKIIFSRFDEVLEQDAKNYDKIEESVMKLTSAPNMEEAALDALTKKSLEPEPEQVNASSKSGGRKTQQTGGISFLNKLTFKVDVWTKQIDKDIIKLNIYLTATMSEFSIILNVIQMNLIVDGLGTDVAKKSAAIKSLMTKNGLIQRSTEYAQTRIGILVHEILKLRADFMYCKSKEPDVKSRLYKLDKFFTTPDVICDENMDKTMDLPFTKYRTHLQRYIDQIIIRLQNGDYSVEMKKSICDNVLKPYVDMLAKCKFSNNPANNSSSSSSAPREVIVAYKLETMSPIEKEEIDRGLTSLLDNLKGNVAKILPQNGGAFGITFTNPLKRAPSLTPEQQKDAADAAEKAAITARELYVTKIKNEPFLLTTDTQISEFLNKVYEFTRRVGKTDPAVIKAAEVAARKLIDEASTTTTTPSTTTPAPAPAPAPAQTRGGSRIPRRRVTRKKVRQMITNKTKTYKVLL